jgi:hypothetical protein
MSYTCPVCGAVSGHPHDEQEGYCGRCHAFTRDWQRVHCPACRGDGCEQCDGHGYVWAIPDAELSAPLDALSTAVLVAAAIEDYRIGPTAMSLFIGIELGRRGYVPTRAEHRAMGLSERVPYRPDPE